MRYIGIILAGGKGKRLGALTKKTPKPLLKINEHHFLDILLYKICQYQFKKIFIICSYKSHLFVKKYHKKFFFGVLIICVIEKKPKDTGGALFDIKKKINNDFFLFNGDTFFNINIDKFYQSSIKSKQIVSLALTKNNNYKENQKLNGLSLFKKKFVSFSEAKTSLMNGGIYFIKKTFLKGLQNKKTSFENHYLKKLIFEKKVFGKIYQDYFIDIGTIKNLLWAKKTLLKQIKFKCAFLDRDGVVNEDKGYTHKQSDLKILPGVFQGIRYLNSRKFLIIIITNQSGIGRGYYTVNKFHKFNSSLIEQLNANRSYIDDLFYCPHHPSQGLKKFKKTCPCRKPKNGMIIQASKKWNIDLKKSFMVGDSYSDYLCAKKSKVKFVYFNKNFLKTIKQSDFFTKLI